MSNRSRVSLIVKHIDEITIREDFVIFFDAFHKARLCNNNRLYIIMVNQEMEKTITISWKIMKIVKK